MNHETATHDVELYFYDELSPAERAVFERHLPGCDLCRAALDELYQIRTALEPMRGLANRSRFEWGAFMRRLEARLDGRPPAAEPRPRPTAILAIAAALAIGVAIGALWQRERTRSVFPGAVSSDRSGSGVGQSLAAQARLKAREAAAEHLERSKIVLLGLANKDAGAVSADDWAYERSLAASLLPDTRLLRLSALETGDAELASLLNDLEVLMLQASFSAEPDRETLFRLQRYINRRDLLVRTELGL